MLHWMGAQLMKVRIMQTNALGGMLCDLGIVPPEGHRVLLKRVQDELATVQEQTRLGNLRPMRFEQRW